MLYLKLLNDTAGKGAKVSPYGFTGREVHEFIFIQDPGVHRILDQKNIIR